MPPKELSPAQHDLAKALTTSFAVPEAKATDLAAHPKQSTWAQDLVAALPSSSSSPPSPAAWDEAKGKLLAALITGSTKLSSDNRLRLARWVADGRLDRADKLAAAVKFVEAQPGAADDAVEQASGVGVDIPASSLPSLLEPFLASLPTAPASWADLPKALAAVRTHATLRWALPLELKAALEGLFEGRFGDQKAEKERRAKEPKPAKAAKSAPSAAASSSEPPAVRNMYAEGFLAKLHAPGGNAQKNPARMAEHLAATGGKVITRFPPEPNGYLHIGHSKAIAVNFGYAAFHGGHTYLRYDDTNPSAEEGAYFESILEMVRWLGFEPWTVSYSSDHFQRLFDLAAELVRRDKAYMCFCSADEQFAFRGGAQSQVRTACPHRSRPVADSLADFERMRQGAFKKGEATLRMKQDLASGNPHMWDMVAYRIVEADHHRTGDTWKIYPTYDFTHCLVDSFENISHSLCTTEFILARESYEWLCDALDVYKPRQSEYGRLNIQGTVMSKRKIKQLVDDGHVRGWDDPRIYTLIALRRRGVPPGAILSFVQNLGVSTTSATIELAKFEQAVRAYLESAAPRLNVVLRPLKLTIANVPDDYRVVTAKPLHPKIPAMGSYELAFTKTVFIDRDDFRLEDSNDYFRLAPGKSVGLFGAPYPVTCTDVVKDADGTVVEVIVKLESEGAKKPKAFIQWVPLDPLSSSPVIVDETRIFHPLFHSDDPAGLDDYLADINPASLEIVTGAMVEPAFFAFAKRSMADARAESEDRTAKALAGAKKDDGAASAAAAAAGGAGAKAAHDDTPKATVDQLVGPECVRFQGLRVAYFALDKDASLGCLAEGADVPAGRREGDRIVLNRIVSLKEDLGKKA